MKRMVPVAWSLVLAASATAATPEIVISLPLGADGIHFEGVGVPDASAWGPTALAIDGAGRFWIADAVARRVLGFAPTGERIATIDLTDAVATISDIEAAAGGLWVLDGGSEPARVLRLAPCGERLARLDLSPAMGLDAGLSGLGRGPRGEALVEMAGGDRLFQITDDTASPLPRAVPVAARSAAGAEIHVLPADWSGPTPGRALVTTGARAIPVETTHLLGHVDVLSADGGGAATLLVEEVALEDVVMVDVTVRRHDAWGSVEMARVPPSFLHVPHGVALHPDGAIYALVTADDGAAIHRLTLSREIPQILPARGFPLSAQPPASDILCISRTTMVSNAWGYRNRYTTLSSTNISGSCTGRTKPRYLGSPGSYRSISYDWGGFDTAAGFSSYMASSYKAGDINTAGVESCSKGVDCSGFVSRCWGTSSKYGTSTLPSISTQLSSTNLLRTGDILNKAGSHVVMVDYITSSGVWAWESTTGGYDRVIYNYNSWSRYSGYLPRRYVNVCP